MIEGHANDSSSGSSSTSSSSKSNAHGLDGTIDRRPNTTDEDNESDEIEEKEKCDTMYVA